MLGAPGLGRSAIGGYIAGDLGSGDSYNLFSGYTLSGPNAANGVGYGLAVQFRISGPSPVAFGSAELALTYYGGTNALNLLLETDSGGAPGETLEAMTVTGIPAGTSLVTATSTTGTLLNPGTEYWLVASATNDTYLAWMTNNQGSSGHLAYRIDTGSGPEAWQAVGAATDPAFAISAEFSPTVVPEPPSALLLSLGLIGVVGLKRARGPRRAG
jgi:hypothetical protein